MTQRLGVVMDPIASIKTYKDSTFAMLLEAQGRSWELHYFEQQDLFLRDGQPWGRSRALAVRDEVSDWFSLADSIDLPLTDLDAILMRKDPPFDMEYVYTTYILERAEIGGTLVVNRPQALRDANEKLFTAWFPQCCPPTLVARAADALRGFLEEHGEVIVKPLDAMGGASIFRLRAGDPNVSVVLETLTANGRKFAMIQRYVPEIAVSGDKRILLVDGQPIPYALARIPAPGETRGNLAAGASGHGVALNERDRWICEQVGQELRARGLLFVGLDVIGDYLTEVNVTSPTCIRELDTHFGLNIAGVLLDAIAARLESRTH